MSITDLNDPLQFAKATLGDIAGIASLFTNKDPKEWDILEGSYNGVKFHIFESKSDYLGALSNVSDAGGRRKVKYRFPYKDGQTTDDLGRKPETFTLNIVLFGEKYLTGLKDLFAELQKPEPGELIHPVRGPIECVMEDFRLLHQSNQRKAVALQLTMIEHNFTIGEFRSDVDSTAKGAISALLDAIAGITDIIDKVSGVILFAASVQQAIVGLLENFQNNSTTTTAKLNRTFNPSGSVDIPTLLPVNQGGSEGDLFPVVVSPNDPFANIPLEDLQPDAITAIAVQQLTQEVNDRRDEVNEIIDAITDGADDGPLELHDEILQLKNVGILLQDALEKGEASSQTRILDFTTPRDMSIREIAFENGIPVDQSTEIDLLNPTLLSVNHVPKGTTVKVPIS